MISKSVNSKVTQLETLEQRRQYLKQSMQSCRAGTLKLFTEINYDTFCRQAHSDYSPAGWHLGHIAYTEALWLLGPNGAGKPPLFKKYHRLFAADGLPKVERVYLPTLAEVCFYLNTVRTQVFDYLEVAPLDEQERLWRWLIQHESQHSETITFVLQLQSWQDGQLGILQNHKQPQLASKSLEMSEMVEIAAGYFEQGNNSIDALDNERPVHPVYLETYWIDRYPVTCGQYRIFMEAGGYQNPTWWSPAGWEWLQRESVTQPFYWTNNPTWDDHPVYGVSAYEAEAYARFVGKRLPTEAEWEKAASWDAINSRRRTYPWGEAEPALHLGNYAELRESSRPLWQKVAESSNCFLPPLQTTPVATYAAGQSIYGCYDMLGNVWEWTASWFDGYGGFAPYPYPGYSKTYFDGQHRVLKGGSWATRPWALRCAFRNWYYPNVRQIIAGFRCAKGIEAEI